MGPWSYAREATVEPSHRTVRACGPRSSRALRGRVGHCAPRARAQRGAARRAPVRGARGAGHRRAHDRLLAASGRPRGDRRGRPSRAGARARRACRAGEALGQRRTDPLLRRAAPDRLAVPARRRQAGGPAYGGNQASSSATLAGPENRFERGQGALYEVYLPIRTPDGTPLLFETYQRRAPWPQRDGASGPRSPRCFSRASRCCGSCRSHSPARLDRRLRETQEEREALLVARWRRLRDERRRIAAELHDGVVQDLAGISYSLSAAAQAEPSATTRGTLAAAAAGTRGAMRRLRSLLVEIHPPNLRASGLEAALDDAAARLRARGVDVVLDLGHRHRAQRRGRAARVSGGGGVAPQRRAPRTGDACRRRAPLDCGRGGAPSRGRRRAVPPQRNVGSAPKTGTWACRSSRSSPPAPAERSRYAPLPATARP